jgi:hypothetical protein
MFNYFTSTYLATKGIHSLTSTFNTDTCRTVLSAYLLAGAASKAQRSTLQSQSKNPHFLTLLSPERLPFLPCLVVREQTRFTSTNSKISMTIINLSWRPHSSRHSPKTFLHPYLLRTKPPLTICLALTQCLGGCYYQFERCGTVLCCGRKPRRILQGCEERQRPGTDGFCHRYLLESNIYSFLAYPILNFFLDHHEIYLSRCY